MSLSFKSPTVPQDARLPDSIFYLSPLLCNSRASYFHFKFCKNTPKNSIKCGDILRICVIWALKNLVVRVLASHFGSFFAVFG